MNFQSIYIRTGTTISWINQNNLQLNSILNPINRNTFQIFQTAFDLNSIKYQLKLISTWTQPNISWNWFRLQANWFSIICAFHVDSNSIFQFFIESNNSYISVIVSTLEHAFDFNQPIRPQSVCSLSIRILFFLKEHQSKSTPYQHRQYPISNLLLLNWCLTWTQQPI